MKKLRLLMLAVCLVALNVGFADVKKLETFQQDGHHHLAKRVSQTEFKEKLKSLKDVQLIDVRTEGEFNAGSIDGAVNIDFNSADFKTSISKLDKRKPSLIFCHSGGRSAQALKQFTVLHFDYVLELEGGFSKWK
jgi:rhodanese-related sulfurtransferase